MTEIEWTDETWNPTRGCSRVSEGCRHCYAEVQAARIVRMGRGKPTPYDGLVHTVGGEPRWTGAVAFDPMKLAAPLSWRAPKTVFVNSMSDLFHESLTNEKIAAVFGVMAACRQHTFQVLTKREFATEQWTEIHMLRERLAERDKRVAELEAAAPRETSASIAAWADETFGPVESNMSIFRRAAKEFHELLEKLEANDHHPYAAAECADVCIVLDRLVHRLGKDMVQERDRKMRINRARMWPVTGDGHGQHVESKEQGQ